MITATQAKEMASKAYSTLDMINSAIEFNASKQSYRLEFMGVISDENKAILESNGYAVYVTPAEGLFTGYTVIRWD